MVKFIIVCLAFSVLTLLIEYAIACAEQENWLLATEKNKILENYKSDVIAHLTGASNKLNLFDISCDKVKRFQINKEKDKFNQ